MIIKCPECGHQVSDRARVCPSCGIDIAGKVTRCPDCGEYIFKDDRECPNCHCPINASAEPAQTGTPENPDNPEYPGTTGTPFKAGLAASPAPAPRKKSRKGLWSAIIVAFILALIIVFLGIYFVQKTQQQNELRSYENAIMSSEPAVLQNFLDMYVEAPVAHRDSIKAHLEVLKKIDRDWDAARISDNKKTLQLFIDRNPENIHVREAQLLIDSLDFVAAKRLDSQDAYRRYMEEHAQGYYYDEARSEYDRLAEEARQARLKAEEDSIAAARAAADAAAVAP